MASAIAAGFVFDLLFTDRLAFATGVSPRMMYGLFFAGL